MLSSINLPGGVQVRLLRQAEPAFKLMSNLVHLSVAKEARIGRATDANVFPRRRFARRRGSGVFRGRRHELTYTFIEIWQGKFILARFLAASAAHTMFLPAPHRCLAQKRLTRDCASVINHAT